MKKDTQSDVFFLLRYLAESNCSTQFCRLVPHHSAKVP